jgi:hypothetical protein
MENRKVDRQLVWEAILAVLVVLRAQWPGFHLHELLAMIGPRLIYNDTLPRLFGKKGSYGQVAPWVKEIKAEMLAEAAGQEEAVPTDPPIPLPERVATALAKLRDAIMALFDSLAASLAVAYADSCAVILRDCEARVAAAAATAVRQVEVAEAESAEHLSAAAAFEQERDTANDRADQAAAELAETQGRLSVVTDQVEQLSKTAASERERADKATKDGSNAHAAATRLEEQLIAATTRAELSAVERDAAKAETREERGRVEKAVAAESGAKSAAARMEEKLEAATVRADKAEAEKDAAVRKAQDERDKAEQANTEKAAASETAARLHEKLTALTVEVARLKEQLKSDKAESEPPTEKTPVNVAPVKGANRGKKTPSA